MTQPCDYSKIELVSAEARAKLTTIAARLERIEAEREDIIHDIEEVYATISQVETTVMEWRVCAGRPRYEVSEHGDVRIAETGKRLKGAIDSDGYLRYGLVCPDGIKRAPAAHILVAETFIGPKPSDDHQVAHRNGSRLHNHFSNLRWVTSQQNHADRIVHNTAAKGEGNPRAKLTTEDVIRLRLEYRAIKSGAVPGTVPELAAKYGIAHASLCNIASGKSWSHVPMPPKDDAYERGEAA